MKIDEITRGNHKAGSFMIGIQPPVFNVQPDDSLDYFEVLVFQVQDKNKLYINLVEDERFNHFDFIHKTFSRILNDNDVVEYNDYVNTLFHKRVEQMPTFKLSRRSIVFLFDKCQSISKKIRKGK